MSIASARILAVEEFVLTEKERGAQASLLFAGIRGIVSAERKTIQAMDGGNFKYKKK